MQVAAPIPSMPRPVHPKFDLLVVSLVPEVALKIMIDEINIIEEV